MSTRTILDATGAEWDVRSEEPTPMGFSVFRGRPTAERNSGRRAGPAIIVTAEVLAYLEERRTESTAETARQLGIGSTALKRLRREAGHNRYADLSGWWSARLADLESLTLEEFCAKHGTTMGSTEYWRLALVGKVIREPGWYRDESALEVLESPVSASEAATFLGGIAPGSVGRLRSKLSAEGLIEREGTPVERMARSKRGLPVSEKTRKALRSAAKKRKSPEHRRRIAMGLAKHHRENPGIAVENFDLKPWTPEEEAILGTALDREIARRLGRTIPAVRMRRKALGIPAIRIPWSMPVPKTDLARKISALVRRRYQTISGAVRATGVAYKRLWVLCEGDKRMTDQLIDTILSEIHATRADLETEEES